MPTTHPISVPDDPAIRELFDDAAAVLQHSYSPYSKFRVGAALRGADGKVYAGCNVESAAYPQSSCAEASAISVMIASGEQWIVEAVVLCDSDELSTCCGGCRQRLREFVVNLDVPIHFGNPQGLMATFTLGELLPASFGPENLGIR